MRVPPNNPTGTTQQDEARNSRFVLYRVLELALALALELELATAGSLLSSLAGAASLRRVYGKNSDCRYGSVR